MGPTTKIDVCNCAAIRKAARHVTLLYDRHLSATGLRVTQFGILSWLDRLGPRSINELAATLQMDRTTMGRTIRPLERDGLVQITTDPRDGRRRPLSITPSGRERLAAGRDGWLSAQAAFDEAYGAGPALALRETMAGLTGLAFKAPAARN